METHPAFATAKRFFDLAGSGNDQIHALVHPEESFAVGTVEADISALNAPGISSTPKSDPRDADIVAFDVLEHVLEDERTDMDWKAPMSINTKYSDVTGEWLVTGITKHSWG